MQTLPETTEEIEEIATETSVQTHAVNRLELTNFRNHAHTELDVGSSSVVLYGENGAGKTNILEAISLLAPGRGFRRARLLDMDYACHPERSEGSHQAATDSSPTAQNDVVGWTVFAEASGTIGEVSIGTAREQSIEGEKDRRLVRVDGDPLKSPNGLAEYLCVLWLTPTSDQLFLEGGTVRRKFLDRLVYGFDAAHARRVNRYEQAMRERNRLLMTYGAQDEWFDGVELQMAEIGTSIAFARQQAVEHINAVMKMSELSFPKAHLELSGVIEATVQEGLSAAEVEAHYRDKLAASRAGDRQNGRSSVGINRTEFIVIHQEKNAEAARCSTGEQKALLLAIILAEARASKLWHGRVPILLLDEVAAHLDPQKRTELYQEIQELGVQVWMSGVSGDLFKEMLGNVTSFRVEKGKIFRE